MDKNIYDKYWLSGLHKGSTMSDSEFQKVFGPIMECKTILDYGCGMGYNYQDNILRFTDDYLGADISEVVMEDLSEKGLKGSIIREDGSFDNRGLKFDGATCVEVFEHLYDPLSAAKAICLSMSEGGTLVATVPNFGYHIWRLKALFQASVHSEPEDWKNDPFKGVHIRYFSARSFRELLIRAGFSKVQITAFDKSCIWDLLRIAGKKGAFVNAYARKLLPPILQLQFLEKIYPSIFALRIRAVAIK
jgi:SAM-dependent methyltransferase